MIKYTPGEIVLYLVAVVAAVVLGALLVGYLSSATHTYQQPSNVEQIVYDKPAK